MLLEKMVNPKNIVDSPHQLPNKALQGSKTPFSPLHYLINTHRQAFGAVMKLWGKRPLKIYGARMTESVLTILCHILKGIMFVPVIILIIITCKIIVKSVAIVWLGCYKLYRYK